MKAFLARKLLSFWFKPPRNWLDRSLLTLAKPLSRLAERKIIRDQASRRGKAPRVPVIVVGNLLVGGAGKTPITIEIARALSLRGLKVGILASGYGSPAYARKDRAIVVDSRHKSENVGDEPVLMRKSTGLPVAVSGQRLLALKALLRNFADLDVIISDDGLQHVALPRTIELCVIDARGFGNGQVLPAGPLREPVSSLANVDALLLNAMDNSPELAHAIASALRPGSDALERINRKPRFTVHFSELRYLPLAQWQKRETSKENFRPIRAAELTVIAAGRPIGALAGTASPEGFFSALRHAGLEFTAHPLPDHATFDRATLRDVTEPFVIMTEKDAVKWPHGRAQNPWVAVRDTLLDPRMTDWLLKKIRR